MRMIRIMVAFWVAIGMTVLIAPAASAKATTTTTRAQTTADIDNACTGEFIQFAGTLVATVKERADGRVDMKATFNARGVGDEGGRYSFSLKLDQRLDGDDFRMKSKTVVKNTGKGKGKDLVIRTEIRIVDGEMTVNVADETRCKGGGRS